MNPTSPQDPSLADDARKIAELLLRTHAVTLNIQEPYRYASGILSPIYCDNRLLLSFPDLRRRVVAAFCRRIHALTATPQLVAGVATAGIAWAAWIADACELPLAYVRDSAKKHGKGNTIEGAPPPGARTVVIEDLLSTGGSSAAAVSALRAAELNADVCLAIFSYQLEACRNVFRQLNCTATSLTTFSVLLDVAGHLNMLSSADIEIARFWNRDPQAWGENHASSTKTISPRNADET